MLQSDSRFESQPRTGQIAANALVMLQFLQWRREDLVAVLPTDARALRQRKRAKVGGPDQRKLEPTACMAEAGGRTETRSLTSVGRSTAGLDSQWFKRCHYSV